jgi:hypothetical protein
MRYDPRPIASGLRPRTSRLLRLATALGVVLAAAPASAFVFRGVALSDRGVYVHLVVRAHPLGPSGLVGHIRCRPGTVKCLFRRGQLGASFASDGSFRGAVAAGNGTQCIFVGVLTSSSLEGRYDCLTAARFEDEGTFQVAP